MALTRQFLANKKTTGLLLLSLSVGLTAYILISAKVGYNFSNDTYLKDYKHIYRIGASAYTDNSLTLSQPRTPRILGQTIEEASPEVKRSGYICRTIENHYKIGDEAFTNDAGFHCSDGFLQIFAIEIIQGKTWDLLTGPNRVIISESFARKYFGDENPVGEILHQYPAGRFEIEAVYRDFPENSHVRPDFLI